MAGNIPKSTFSPLSFISFANASDGWAFGPDLVVTHDGGHTWKPIRFAARGEIVSLGSVGASVWVLERGCPEEDTCPTVLRTSSNGGRTWRKAAGPMLSLAKSELVRFGTRDAWILSYQPIDSPTSTGQLWKTTDGGATWKRFADPCDQSFDEQLAAASDDDLYILCSGEPGAGNQLKSLRASHDAGRHWDLPLAAPESGYPIDLLVAGETLWLTALRGGLAYSSDGGAHWAFANVPSQSDYAGWSPLHFAGSAHAWVADYGIVFRTDDGGLHWSPVRLEHLFPGVSPSP